MTAVDDAEGLKKMEGRVMRWCKEVLEAVGQRVAARACDGDGMHFFGAYIYTCMRFCWN